MLLPGTMRDAMKWAFDEMGVDLDDDEARLLVKECKSLPKNYRLKWYAMNWMVQLILQMRVMDVMEDEETG